MKYENNLHYIWKKGGRLIIRVVLYLGQYGNLKLNK